MKHLFKAAAFVLVLALTISLLGWGATTYAYAKDSKDYTIDEIDKILEASSTTQTIVASETEMIEQMIAEGMITKEQLNHELQKLSPEKPRSIRIRPELLQVR